MPQREWRATTAVACLSNETIFELNELAARMVVLGAGPIGVEMAQAFRRLGSEVTVVEPAEGILSRDDPAGSGCCNGCSATAARCEKR